MSRRTRRTRKTHAARAATAPAKPPAAPRAARSALTRRRFMTLLAAGSAAALLPSARDGLAATAPAGKPVTTPAPIPPSPKVKAEIDKQKKSTAEQLKVIRNFVLPAGSPMAFEFRPLRRGRK
jgi:hypothetical protein